MRAYEVGESFEVDEPEPARVAVETTAHRVKPRRGGLPRWCPAAVLGFCIWSALFSMAARGRPDLGQCGLVGFGLGAALDFALSAPAAIDRSQARVQSDGATFMTACRMFRVDARRYPRSAAELLSSESGPYLEEWLVDPWGFPYELRYQGATQRPEIWSYGADGRPGGEGRDADLRASPHRDD